MEGPTVVRSNIHLSDDDLASRPGTLRGTFARCLEVAILSATIGFGAARAATPAVAPVNDKLAPDCTQIADCLAAEKKSCRILEDRGYCGCLVQQGCYSRSTGTCTSKAREFCGKVSWSLSSKNATRTYAVLPQKLQAQTRSNDRTNALVPTLKIKERMDIHLNAPLAAYSFNADASPTATLLRPGQVKLYPWLRLSIPSLATSRAPDANRRMSFDRPPRPVQDLIQGAAAPDPLMDAWLGKPTGNPLYPDSQNASMWPVGSCFEYAYQKNFEYLWLRDKARAHGWTPREVFSVAMMKTIPGVNRTLSTFGLSNPAWQGHTNSPSTKAEFQYDRKTTIPWNIFVISADAVYGVGYTAGAPIIGPVLGSEQGYPKKSADAIDTSDVTRLPGRPMTDVFERHALLEKTYRSLPPRPGRDGKPVVDDTGQPLVGVTDAEFADIEQRLRIHAQKLLQYSHIMTKCGEKGNGKTRRCHDPERGLWNDVDVPVGGGYTFAQAPFSVRYGNLVPDCDPSHSPSPPPGSSGKYGKGCPALGKIKNEDLPKFKSALGKQMAQGCWQGNQVAEVKNCWNEIREWDDAIAQLEVDIQEGINFEKSLGEHGCMHPDSNKNKCNWAYSMFANWVTTAGDSIVEKDVLTCNKLVPDFSVLSNWEDGQLSYVQKRELFPWCKSRTPQCVMGCCSNTPEQLCGDPNAPNADSCSGNLAQATQSQAFVDYSKSLAGVERFFSRRQCAKEDWLNFVKSEKACYIRKVVKPQVAQVSDLPFGNSIGQRVGDEYHAGSPVLGAGFSYGLSWNIDHDQIAAFDSATINHGNCAANPQDVLSGCCTDGPCYSDEKHICALNGNVHANINIDGSLFGQSISLLKADALFDFKGVQGSGSYDASGVILELLGKTMHQDPTPLTGQGQGTSFTLPAGSRSQKGFSETFYVGPVPVTVAAGVVLSAGLELNQSGEGHTCTPKTHPEVGFTIANTIAPTVSADAFAEGGVGGDFMGIGASAGVRVAVNLVTFKLPFALNFGVDPQNGIGFKAKSDAEMRLMAGRLMLYAEVDYLVGSSDWEWDLWSWDGFTTGRNIASWDKSFSLKGFSWHYYPPDETSKVSSLSRPAGPVKAVAGGSP